METEHDEALINQYVGKIRALVVRAAEGENVKTEVKVTVTAAIEDLDIRSTRNPAANVAAFKSRLEMMAAITVASQRAEKETLGYAASLIKTRTRNNGWLKSWRGFGVGILANPRKPLI
jgi:hypothetical protein